MDDHVRRLGVWSIAYGACTGSVAIILLAWFGGPGGLIDQADEAGLSGFFLVLAAIVHLVVAVPLVVGGYGVRRYADWSRPVMTLVCALNLMNMPVGTLLGAYGLWVLSQPETEPLFDPSFPRPAKAPVRAKEKLARGILTNPKPVRPDLPK